MSRLQDVINQYRQRLLDHERSAQAALDYAHKQTVALIEVKMQVLYDQISSAMDDGTTISLSWLFEHERLDAILQYITQAIDHYGALTQMQVAQLQHLGVQLGQQSGMALLQSTVPQGVTFAFGIPDQQAIANLIGATQKGSPLADLFSGFGAEAAQAAKDALISGVTLGYGPRQIAPGIQDALDISRNRALTIARTESLRAYRGANLATFQANSDVVGQWRWTCAFSMRTCAACIAMDGTLHDLSESMDSHPNCRCTMTPVTKSWDDILGPLGIDTTGIEDTNPALDMQTGQEWFNGLDADQQRQILGNAKYDAFADGKFDLSDIVGTNDDPDWGKSIFEKPLKELIK
jgi:SPP1 gp7 family putative phage head morphogenesis protein